MATNFAVKPLSDSIQLSTVACKLKWTKMVIEAIFHQQKNNKSSWSRKWRESQNSAFQKIDFSSFLKIIKFAGGQILPSCARFLSQRRMNVLIDFPNCSNSILNPMIKGPFLGQIWAPFWSLFASFLIFFWSLLSIF